VIIVALAIALLGTGIWTYQSLVAGGGGGAMKAPAGYTAQQMIFDDQFSGTSLDTTKWNTYLGAQGIVWSLPNAAVPGGIVAEPYEIILDLPVATASDHAFHTLPMATSPGGSMEVTEVQAYSSS
jgi:hypothetical protein